MKLTIELVTNGWVVSGREGDDEWRAVVQPGDDDTDSEAAVHSFVSLLWLITDHVGPQTNRYSRARVRISVEPGDKAPDPGGCA